jgi:uncharacterized membrane protein YkoI
MHTWFRAMAACAALTLSVMASAAWAKEEEVPLDKLPKAVVDAVKAKFPGAKLLEASKETENGATTYEVTVDHKGQEFDISLTPAGKIVEVEREIEIADLPKAVVEALKKKYPKCKLDEAEEIVADGKTLFEVTIETADDKDLIVTLDAKGMILEEEEADDDGDEQN